jgi:hypothetical protein
MCSLLGNAYRILDGNIEGKRPPGTSSGRLEDNIKMGFKYGENVDWIQLTQDKIHG